MPALSKLSAKKLREEIAKREKPMRELRDRVLAAGFGDARYSDLREFAKKSSLLSKVVLVREYLAAFDSVQEARDELAARERFHGSDKPIRQMEPAK